MTKIDRIGFQRAFLLLLLICYGSGNAQHSEFWIRINELSKFIAGFEPSVTDSADIFSMDKIFIKAVELCDNDTSEALITATFAVLPYNKVPIRIKLLGLNFGIPVYSSDGELFYRKNMKVPGRLYWDIPAYNNPDKDKPAHFFGSAFLSYSLKNDYICNKAGEFVEIFEESFTPDNKVDSRDLRTNVLGRKFGQLLSEGRKILPSVIFFSYNFGYLLRNL